VLITRVIFLLEREHADATERPTHAGGYADVGNNNIVTDIVVLYENNGFLHFTKLQHQYCPLLK